VRPLCNYPQYHNKLIQYDILYVDNILKLDVAFFSDMIGIPVPAVDAFLDYAKRVTRKAEKSKSLACSIKNEENTTDNNKENEGDWVF